MIKTQLYYLWDYTITQINQIAFYYLLGVLIGSFVSVCFKQKISNAMDSINKLNIGIIGIFISTILGILSPLCMYGTIPIVASLHESKMREDWITSFMIASICMNPQLFVYSFALGKNIAILRLLVCCIVAILAGLLIRIFAKTNFYSFTKLYETHNNDTDKNKILRYLKNVGRNIRITFPYFIIGILLTSLYQLYVPREFVIRLFINNRGLGSLIATALGVPLYTCGGGTIPLIKTWLEQGMSLGSAVSFMIAGQATKLTNLGALKIALGKKNFVIYFIYIVLMSTLSGIIVDILI